MNAQTKEPVADAVVFHNGNVARSDEGGRFQLPKINEKKPLLIKACGYKQASVKAQKDSEPIVYLEPFDAKGIFLSHDGVNSAELREPVLKLIDDTALNALVLDIKGDRGFLSFDCDSELAHQIGAMTRPTIEDPVAFVKKMHARGIYLIGRIVVFKDTMLANKKPEWAIIDSRTKKPWVDKEKLAWVDPFQKKVWEYNISLAVAAAEVGFDEIQFDYVRFPTGETKGIRYSDENNEENRVAAISGLLEMAYRRLLPYNVYLSADVFGMTVWNDNDSGIGQRISRMSPFVDYISPMVYPSGFSTGLPGYQENAIAIPREVVRESMKQGMQRLGPNSKRLRPWLQHFRDYSFDRRLYKEPEIALQVLACNETKTSGWLFWNAGNRYDYIAGGLKLLEGDVSRLRSEPPPAAATTTNALTNSFEVIRP